VEDAETVPCGVTFTGRAIVVVVGASVVVDEVAAIVVVVGAGVVVEELAGTVVVVVGANVVVTADVVVGANVVVEELAGTVVVVGGGGGPNTVPPAGALVSALPSVPMGRPNFCPVVESTRTISLIGRREGATTATDVGLKVGQDEPV